MTKADLNSRDDDFFICGKVLYSSPLLLETLRQLSYVSDWILSGDLFLYLFLNVDFYEWMLVETVPCCHEWEIMDDCTVPLMNRVEGERLRGFYKYGAQVRVDLFAQMVSDGSLERENWSAGVTDQVVIFNYTCTSVKN